MFRKWMEDHWAVLTAGCLLTAAAVQIAYAERGYAAIGSEWAITPIMLLAEKLVKTKWKNTKE